MKKSEETRKDRVPNRGGSLAPTKGAHKQDKPRRTDDALDEALEESFPSSDPPSQTAPVTQVGGKKKSSKH